MGSVNIFRFCFHLNQRLNIMKKYFIWYFISITDQMQANVWHYLNTLFFTNAKGRQDIPNSTKFWRSSHFVSSFHWNWLIYFSWFVLYQWYIYTFTCSHIFSCTALTPSYGKKKKEQRSALTPAVFTVISSALARCVKSC